MLKKQSGAFFKSEADRVQMRPQKQLWRATITDKHLKMVEMDSATQKKTDMTYHSYRGGALRKRPSRS